MGIFYIFYLFFYKCWIFAFTAFTNGGSLGKNHTLGTFLVAID